MRIAFHWPQQQMELMDGKQRTANCAWLCYKTPCIVPSSGIHWTPLRKWSYPSGSWYPVSPTHRQHVQGIHQQKEAPCSKLGNYINILVMEGLYGLTSNIPITAKTNKILATPPSLQGTCLHKINGFSLNSGNEPSSHMSSKASCLGSRMSLFWLRDDHTVVMR